MLIKNFQGRQSWGGWGGTRFPQFLDWGDDYLIVPPIFSYVQLNLIVRYSACIVDTVSVSVFY